MNTMNPTKVLLRPVTAADLPLLFEHQLDPEANRMAAFTAEDPADRSAFMAHWAKILANANTITRTIVYEGQVAGYIAGFEQFGKPSVGYWLGRAYWGKGIATAALASFLTQVTARPLYARVAKDNSASRRVLEKCGFTICGEDKGFSHARGQQVEEFILVLNPEA